MVCPELSRLTGGSAAATSRRLHPLALPLPCVASRGEPARAVRVETDAFPHGFDGQLLVQILGAPGSDFEYFQFLSASQNLGDPVNYEQQSHRAGTGVRSAEKGAEGAVEEVSHGHFEETRCFAIAQHDTLSEGFHSERSEGISLFQ